MSDKAPRSHQLPTDVVKKKGLVMVNTGDGKGKSTAAYGTALRALGHGYKVAVVQFIKGEWQTGESKACSFFKNQYQFFSYGEGFTWQTKDLAKDKALAKQAWQKCLGVLHDDNYFLVIFDEINYCLQYEFLETQEVLDALKQKPADKHVFLTGGGAPKALIEIADLVTEFKKIKHPYDQGIVAQKGIEF